ncbi:MAG TPA: hypothetical protein PJ984_03045 [Candidatus Saccharibacteria bacterium]|jgi:hypothetical protein|nr:hypothetical protein [Patescibacteria group bacterium]HMS31346.1 hypothetical protein [Candidatus Saccharibacteria bacterium]
MLLTATMLIALGVLSSLLGLKLFKILLPLLGLVSGIMVGFAGVQGVFGSGTLSTTMAVFVSFVVGLLLAVLSYVFFELAVIVFVALIGASAFSYMGVALGLREEGFLVFMLALSGAIIGATVAARYGVGAQIVVALTSMLGVAWILAGFMLVVGKVSLDEIAATSVAATMLRIVDQSFLWFFVWFGGSLVAMQVQHRLARLDTFTTAFEYDGK